MKRASMLVLALAASCAGPSDSHRGGDRTDLVEAWPLLADPDVIELEKRLVPLIDRAAESNASERFWAAFTLSQAHALAAQSTSGRQDPDHRRATEEVAALYYADIAAAHVTTEGTDAASILPEPLAGVSTQDAGLALEFVSLSLLRGLGFDERVARLCRRHELFLDPGAGVRVLERGGIDPRLHAAVWSVVFDELEFVDPRAAVVAAVHALVASDRAEDALSEERIELLESYVRVDSGLVLRCPSCRTPAVPELRSCPNDHTSLERFFVETRSSDG